MKRYLLCGFIGLILGLCFSWMFLTYRDEVIIDDDIKVEFRDEVYVSDFINYIDGTLLDNYLIDTTKLGVNKVKYLYKNNYGWIKSGSFDIEVVDTKEPVIMVGDSYTVVKGYDRALEDVILCADNVDDNVECWIEGEYDLDDIGSYEIEMFARDSSGNSNSAKFTLRVVNKVNTGSNESYIDYRDIYSKYKSSDTLIGIDISKWQGDVDFERLKDNDVEFVMIKLGGQSEIDGEIEMDPYFYDNIEEAILYDIDVGVYFYSYARSVKEAEGQAKYVMNALKGYDITMPIAFDWENFGIYNTFNLSFRSLNNIAKAFISRVEDSGYEGVLYSSKAYLDAIWYRDEYEVWLANYSNTLYDGDYVMWQVCSDGVIDGIDGYVDIDVYYKE